MFDFSSTSLIQLVAGIPGLLMAMVIHEYAHARMAAAMGDPTPEMMGRLTLNPVAHIDPIGLLMLFFVQFGWAKPVMINPGNFRDWRKGSLYVALAGPVSNLITAFIALAVIFLMVKLRLNLSYGLHMVLYLIVLYNVNFAIFNMIPLPPLDGSKVLMAFLPDEMAYKLESIQRYSFIILIALVMTPVLGYILIPLQRLFLGIFSTVLSIVFAI
jgi:Zn-dependent protease